MAVGLGVGFLGVDLGIGGLDLGFGAGKRFFDRDITFLGSFDLEFTVIEWGSSLLPNMS